MKLAEHHIEIWAGPCSADTRENILSSAEAARERGIRTMRASLWKPRTRPGFDGIGIAGIPIFSEIAAMGIRPATEVLLPQQAEQTMNGTIAKDRNARLLLWLGSRNQNHILQRDIARLVAGESRVQLMIKNQPWKDQGHWEGIVEHVLAGGASPSQIILCHRGFAPGTRRLRNVPDMDMALQVKHNISQKLGVEIPLILDPSHIAGKSPENVIRTALNLSGKTLDIDGRTIGVDGLLIETHPNPTAALTDRDQQLSWAQLDGLIAALNRRRS